MSQKTVLITGCSRGVGYGLVKEFLKRNFKVIATCRNPDKATDLRTTLEQHMQHPAFGCDVASSESIVQCVKAVKENGVEKIDILVNNAGISNKNHPDDASTDVNRKEFLDVFNVNVAGCLEMTNVCLPLLQKHGKEEQTETPMVINISSTLGSMEASPRFTTTSYQCSKAAVNMLTKCQAAGTPSIKFVAVHPGWVQTDMGSAKNRSPPVTVQDSANGIIDAAMKLPMEESGSFISFQGDKIPY